MLRVLRFLGLAFVALASLFPGVSGRTVAAEDPPFDARFCVTPPYGAICSTQPFDQADFDRHFVYRVLVKGAQDPFDMFAWQTFVALNWPATKAGEPLALSLGQAAAAPRVWQAFERRNAVFGADRAREACGAGATPGALLIDEREQADGTVLIDQALNFVVYDTRLNAVAADYIRANGLHSRAGQEAFARQKSISFPQGRLPDAGADRPGAPPTVMIKTAWRLLSDPEEAAGFFTVDGVVRVPAERSQSGEESCVPARLGLVGMHLVLRTASGHGDEWIWATFEHLDNVPLAANARDVNSIYAKDLFPGGCQAPASLPEASSPQAYSFFDPDCPACRANSFFQAAWSWAEQAPYARVKGRLPRHGTQVVRCWDIFESTAAVNRRWQQRLAGTVWANYMLISTQWRGANKGAFFEHGEVPRFLTNTTMETFGQSDPKGTCLGCHADAETAAGQAANFIFSLRYAN